MKENGKLSKPFLVRLSFAFKRRASDIDCEASAVTGAHKSLSPASAETFVEALTHTSVIEREMSHDVSRRGDKMEMRE